MMNKDRCCQDNLINYMKLILKNRVLLCHLKFHKIEQKENETKEIIENKENEVPTNPENTLIGNCFNTQ